MPALLTKGRVLEAHLNTERGVASRGGDSQPPPREVRDPARRALRPGREELAVTDPEAIPVREARDRSPKSPRWSAGRRASPVWDARRLVRRLACRVTCRPNGCLASTRRLSALRHPSIGVAKPKFQTPGAKNAPRERRGVCLVRTLSVRHSGRAAIAARAGIHNHRPWIWIPGSRASPAPRNDDRGYHYSGRSSRRMLVTSLPAARMRAIAAAIGSNDTAMWKALAWTSEALSRTIAT